MHNYFKAIGFTKPMTQLEKLNLVGDVVDGETYEVYTTSPDNEEAVSAEFRMDLGSDYGISVSGTFDDNGEFTCDRMEPYLYTGLISSFEQLAVEERIDGSSYAGICDDPKVGVTIIFRLQNAVEYMKYHGNIPDYELLHGASVCLSGLSTEGMIMLPISKTDREVMDSRRHLVKRKQMIRAAGQGDEEAIRDLTVSDMHLYNAIYSKLMEQEDVYSIVDSYFMPTGVECDLYNVMGEIRQCRTTRNPITGEMVYVMTLDCNELRFDICINRMDLFGEPKTGRRFKGKIWMQGTICFENLSKQ